MDGPTSVEDRENTEANRAFIKTYRQAITVEQQYELIGDFLTESYIQHAEGFGDRIARLKARYAGDVKPGTSHVLTPRYFVVDRNFALSVVDAKTDPPKANFDLFRIEINEVAEHWEVLSVIPPQDERKNSNGPFNGPFQVPLEVAELPFACGWPFLPSLCVFPPRIGLSLDLGT